MQVAMSTTKIEYSYALGLMVSGKFVADGTMVASYCRSLSFPPPVIVAMVLVVVLGLPSSMVVVGEFACIKCRYTHTIVLIPRPLTWE